MNLAKIGCTYDEIAAVAGVSKDTLERRCKALIHEGWQHRNASVRRKQYQLAMSAEPVQGQCAMLIWLGKQFLGQRDDVGAQEKSASGRLDQLLSAMQAGAVPRGQVNNLDEEPDPPTPTGNAPDDEPDYDPDDASPAGQTPAPTTALLLIRPSAL